MVTEVVFKDLKGIMNDKPIPWQTRSDPLIRFRTDEGLTYGVQFIRLSFVLDEENQALLVEGHPQGLLMIRGPLACAPGAIEPSLTLQYQASRSGPRRLGETARCPVRTPTAQPYRVIRRTAVPASAQMAA
jgi:hypothetical protein